MDTWMDVDPHIAPELHRSALVVIDTQVDFVDGGASPVPGTTQVLPAITTLLQTYRQALRPIVHVVRLHDGDDVDLPRRSLIASGAPIVRPHTPGSQIVADLLRALDVTTIVVAGCNHPDCPRAAAYGAGERDYRVLIAADAISGVRPEHLQEAGRMGVLAATTDITTRLARTTPGRAGQAGRTSTFAALRGRARPP